MKALSKQDGEDFTTPANVDGLVNFNSGTCWRKCHKDFILCAYTHVYKSPEPE